MSAPPTPANGARRPGNDNAAPITTAEAALAAFLGWVDERAQREPTLAAYVLAGLSGQGIDERRTALAARVPRVIARGLRGLSDGVSWRLRRSLIEAAPHEVAMSLTDQAAEAPSAWTLRELLAEAAPAEVAASLRGLDDETAWALRDQLYDRVPDAVLASLGLLDKPAGLALARALDARTQHAGCGRRRLPERARRRALGHRAGRRARLGVPARRPHRRAGAGHRVAGRPVERPGLALARPHARPRAQDRAVDDRRPRRRTRLGDARGDGVELPRGARFADRPRPPDRLAAAGRLSRSVARVRGQEPGGAGERGRAGRTCCSAR